MKKLALLIVTFAIAASITSCGSASGLASSDIAAKTAGVTCAQALTGLSNSYKMNGTVSLSNSTDLSNMLIVATSYSQLRQHKDDANYKTAFTNGLISGSNLINANNAGSIVNALLNSTGLNNINASNIQSKVETVSTILTLLNALK